MYPRKTYYRRYVPRPVRRSVNTAARSVYSAAKTYVPKGTSAKLGSTIGSAMGAAVAGTSGAAVGSYVGKKLGKQFSRITGVGDYYLHDGTLIGSPQTAKTPILESSLINNSVTISRSEYITDIHSGFGTPSTAFTNQSFAINAGLSITDGGAFSWLPIVASGFQQYRFKQLVFEFRSTSGNAVSSTNSSLGTVIMSANYDSTLPPYTTKTEALNSQWASSSSSDKTLLFPIECRPRESKERWYDIRSQPIKSNQNIAIYDLATFQIATQGLQEEDQNLGELWVSYTIELTKFKSNANYTYTAHWSNSLETGNDISNNYPLGNLKRIAPGPNDNLLMSIDVVSPGVNHFVFPPNIPENSQFLVMCKYTGTGGASAPTLSLTAYEDCELLNFVTDNSNEYAYMTATNIFVCTVYVRTNGPNPKLALTVDFKSMVNIVCDWLFVETATDTCLGAPYPGQRVI